MSEFSLLNSMADSAGFAAPSIRDQFSSNRSRAAVALAILYVLAVVPAEAFASYGPFLHGDGIHSLGFGGVGIVAASDAYALAANPASVIALGDRHDVGLDFEQVYPIVSYRGNLLGPNNTDYVSSFNNVPVPQAGFTHSLGDHFAIGVTGFAAGFGTIYHHSPYERFGGPEQASVIIGQAGLANAIAWKPIDNQAIGIALDLSYQVLRARGLQAFELFSEDPQHVTDQGLDGAFGIGYSAGWQGYLTPWLEAGVAYRSKTWAQRFKEDAGVLPGHGRFDLPARYGGALALHLPPHLLLALETQRLMFAQEKSTGDSINQLYQGNFLGSENGPGFGWKNQTLYKIGVEWNFTPALAVRGGYSRGNRIIGPGETLLSTIAPATLLEHYTLGASYARDDGWEISGYATYSPRVEVRGQNSVPIFVGGGEVDLSNALRSFGVSLGRRW